jgi:glycosyltransferase involved in cell wall biosynthesis
MKLLFAIKRLEDMAGGAERVILQVIDGLHRDYGHDVTLITFDSPNALSFYHVPEGVKWIKLGIGDASRRAGWKDTIRRIWRLRSLVATSDSDILVPFQHSMFIPMVIASLCLGKPVIASEHIVPDHYKSRPLEYGLLILTGLFCRKITVLSEAIIKMYPRCLRSRMVAVPNPVETSSLPANLLGKDRKILLSVGRLDPQKDQKTLIEAFAMIAPKFPDWDLKIIGEGKLREDLERQIQNLQMADRIYLAGLSRNIMSEYQNAQTFVLSSLYEAFGLATAEAMSAGLPVIGFADCPGTNELIQDGHNGILVQVNDLETRAQSLAQSLTHLLSDSDLRAKLGAKGREDMSRLSPENVVRQWNVLLSEINGGGGGI